MSQTPQNPSMDQAFTKGRIKVVVCAINPAVPPVISSLQKLLQSQSTLDYEKTTNAALIPELLRKVDRAIIVVTLSDKDEILSVLQFLKTEEVRIAQGAIRVIVLNRMNHPKIMSALKSKGVGEILEFHVTIKALNLKIKNQLLLLNQHLERQQREERRSAGAEAASAAAGKKAETAPQILWEPPQEHANDFWILTSKKNARYVMGRWLIEILGPGPSAGSWESTDLTWRGEIGWQWKPRDPNNVIFQKEEGSWVFFGRVPEFIWQKNLWSFVAKFPTMAFYRAGELVYHRMKCEQNQIVQFRENSENAKDLLDAIKATMESSLRLNDDQKEPTGFILNLGRESESATGSGSVTNDGADAKSLGFVHATSSGAAPSPAWREHLETEGVDVGKDGVSVPVEKPKSAWGGSSLLEPTAKGASLGLTDLSGSGAKTDGTVFETLKLLIELRARNGVSLAHPVNWRMIDYRDGEVLFDGPAAACGKNEFVEFKATLVLGHRRSEIEVHGQVTLADLVPAESGREEQRTLIAVQIPEEVRKRFETIIHVFQERQIEMNHFFRMARGA